MNSIKNQLIFWRKFLPFCLALFFIGITPAMAAIPDGGILNNVTNQFQTQTATWAGALTSYATWLFWTLGTISLAWTGGTLILKRADIGEFFAEFIRFIMFFGFFLWLLRNAPAIGSAIINSFITMGANASQSGASSPSAVMDIGFNIFHKVMEQTTIWSPVDSVIGAFLAGIILICIALIAANMTILLCAAWILMYGGIFFLGFGGSRWTSEIALHYYKSILGVGASLMAMILMVGIAQNIITNYYNQMSTGININEIATVLVVAVILLLLVHRIPGLITGILTGASIGHSGIATFGSSAAFNTMGAAGNLAATSGRIALEGAKNIVGGGAILLAAAQSAQQHMAHHANSNSPSEKAPANSFASAMGHHGRFMGHMGTSMAKGMGKAIKAHLPDVNDSFTGKIAGHIRNDIKQKAAERETANTVNAPTGTETYTDDIREDEDIKAWINDGKDK